MRHDPKIEVVCDRCGESEFWEPDFTFRDWSGNNGSYDTTDSAFSDWCKNEGWTEGEHNMTFCPDCSEAATSQIAATT